MSDIELNLEVGKTYLNRSGEEVTIDFECFGEFPYPYGSLSNGHWYTVNGKYMTIKDTDKDLITLVCEDTHLIDITEQSRNEIDKINSLLNDDTVRCLKEAKAVLAGGALTSLFTRKDINDFDIYLKSVEGFQYLIQEVYGTGENSGDMDPYNLQVNFATDRSILCREQTTNNAVQLILYQMFPNVESIFSAFDFTVNMCAYDFETEKMWAHPDFIKHCSQRYLAFNSGTHYPIVSALRVQKYVERGYSISKSEMLRILFTIADKQYDSWEKVKSEVVGMYGIPIDEVFDETKPFSLKEVVRQLESSAKVNSNIVHAEAIGVEELAKKFPHLLPKEWIERQGFWWYNTQSNASSINFPF